MSAEYKYAAVHRLNAVKQANDV